jgi:hypothetical protein
MIRVRVNVSSKMLWAVGIGQSIKGGAETAFQSVQFSFLKV